MEYQHGGDIYSQTIWMDYSANINPLGLPEGVRLELARSLGDGVCSVYPDSSCRALCGALADVYRVPAEWISCGNGAADLIFALVYARRPKRALVLAPTFFEYSQALRAGGCRTECHPLLPEREFSLCVPALLEQVAEAGRRGKPYDMVFLCNPNNPTGIPVRREAVLELAAECRRWKGLLVVDECFCDFLEEEERCSVIGSLAEWDNLFVLRAFTKLYAMAGLRLGYGLCRNERLNEELRQVRQPWSVSGLAQRAGTAALRETDYVARTKRLIAQEREWLSGQLTRLGLQVYPSRVNFLLLRDEAELAKPGAERSYLYQALRRRGVLIRSCANYEGLDRSYYRVCVKDRARNQQFMEELGRVWKERAEWQKQS